MVVVVGVVVVVLAVLAAVDVVVEVVVVAVVLGAVVLNSIEVAPLELLRGATRPVRALVFLSAVTVLCGCTAVGWLRRVRTPRRAALAH